MQGLHQCQPRFEFLPSHLITSTCQWLTVSPTAPFLYFDFSLGLPKTDSGTRSLCPLGFPPSTQFQDPSNRFFSHSALSVLWSMTGTISLCARCFSTAHREGILCSGRRHYSPF